MTKPMDFSYIEITGDATNFMESRIAYNGANPEYVGYSRVPNAPTSLPVWFIIKNSFTGSDKTRQQLPDDGPKFDYVWDDRALYFS